NPTLFPYTTLFRSRQYGLVGNQSRLEHGLPEQDHPHRRVALPARRLLLLAEDPFRPATVYRREHPPQRSGAEHGVDLAAALGRYRRGLPRGDSESSENATADRQSELLRRRGLSGQDAAVSGLC